MHVLLKSTAIALACAAGLSVAPSLAGVISPTNSAAVTAASPIDSVYYGGCPWRRHHYHYYRGCHAAWSYPTYTYAYPYGMTAGWGPGWGGGWGAGWGGGGLFGGLFGIL
ncbi:hypothetical protein [Methylocystis bryophila]|nr:hypothetical protein [Methylocystis bryophila]BDV38971.1 hypothetical protein DSM21852_22240 [Methylocystis bryophila]